MVGNYTISFVLNVGTITIVRRIDVTNEKLAQGLFFRWHSRKYLLFCNFNITETFIVIQRPAKARISIFVAATINRRVAIVDPKHSKVFRRFQTKM